MGKNTQWEPADGAEQVDPSAAALQGRASASHFTPQHRSDEPEARRVETGTPDDGFDSGYNDWRKANGSRLDSDYRRWRARTGQPFSDAFLVWAAEQADTTEGS